MYLLQFSSAALKKRLLRPRQGSALVRLLRAATQADAMHCPAEGPSCHSTVVFGGKCISPRLGLGKVGKEGKGTRALLVPDARGSKENGETNTRRTFVHFSLTSMISQKCGPKTRGPQVSGSRFHYPAAGRSDWGRCAQMSQRGFLDVALCPRPSFRRYRSSVGFNFPLELRVVTIWGKAALVKQQKCTCLAAVFLTSTRDAGPRRNLVVWS